VYTREAKNYENVAVSLVSETDHVRASLEGHGESGSNINSGTLFGRFHARLLIFGMRRLGNRADAEDMAQDALQRVAKALDENRLREPGALPGFVFQTARHVCQQWLRKRGRERRALASFGSGASEIDDSAPLTDLIDVERRRAVRLALQSLGAEDRQLLEQLYAHDADPEQVARGLGITAGALRVRRHRALKRLSEMLGEDVTE
jgi:RNA polymerase sigma-70 factor (ECF subfamily)